MNPLAKLGTAAAIKAAFFLWGRCDGVRRATDTVLRERAAANVLASTDLARIAALTGENARLRNQRRNDSLRRVAEAPKHSALQQSMDRLFAEATTPPLDIQHIDAQPLKPGAVDLPAVPDSIVNVLFPGGAWVIRLPNDMQPHLADSALFHWGVWADKQLTLNRVRMRDTVMPAVLELRKSNAAYASLLGAKDSIIATTDAINRIYKIALEDKGIATLKQQRRGEIVYALGETGVVLSNGYLHWDVDRGGYVDSWSTPDKLTHAFAGALLASTAHDALHVPWKWSVPLTCAGAVAFEKSQGWVSSRDILAGCGGAVGVALVRRGIDRIAGR